MPPGANVVDVKFDHDRMPRPVSGSTAANSLSAASRALAPLSNPHGLLSGASARDAADKEFAAVDPDTGRGILSWSNFTSTTFAPGGIEISTTYSDDLGTASPPT